MLVAWTPPRVEPADAPGAATDATGIGPLALGIGAAVPALVASGAWWLGVDYVATVAAVGIPIGGILAALAARRLVERDWIAVTLLLGFGAPLVPGFLIAAAGVLSGIGAMGELGAEQALGGLWFGLLAVVFAHVLGLPVTLPVATIVGILVHRAAVLGTRRARNHVAALVIAAVAASIVTVAAVQGALPTGRVDWQAVRAEVRLVTTIENHTDRERVVEVGWADGEGGETGSLLGVGPCGVATDEWFLEGRDWHLAELAGDEMLPVGPPLATAASWPGDDIALTVEFAGEGAVRVRAGSRPVPDDEGLAERERLPGCG